MPRRGSQWQVMPRRSQRTNDWHFFGYRINKNAVITSVFGTIVSAILLFGWHWAGTKAQSITGNLNAIPQLRTDVEGIKKEQARIVKEYLPPLHPTPTPKPD